MAPHLSHLCSFQVHLIPRLPSKLLVAQDKAWQPSVSTSASGSSICTCFLFTHPLPFDLELNFSPLIATLSTDGPEPTPSWSQAHAPHFHMHPLLLSCPSITKTALGGCRQSDWLAAVLLHKQRWCTSCSWLVSCLRSGIHLARACGCSAGSQRHINSVCAWVVVGKVV